MRTITYGGAVSLDGFLAGPDGSIDWLHTHSAACFRRFYFFW
jgi:hypothetical protein